MWIVVDKWNLNFLLVIIDYVYNGFLSGYYCDLVMLI